MRKTIAASVLAALAAVVPFSFGSNFAFADETPAEKAQEVKEDAQKEGRTVKRKLKKGARKVQGEDSAVERIKEGGAETADEVKDKVDDVQKQVD